MLTIHDLLDCLAIVMTERDALRDRLGLEPLEGRQQFTTEQREVGNTMRPMARTDARDTITIILEG